MLKESPLRIIADPRFQMLVTRAINRNRIVPSSPERMIRSACSSWSSASVVSTIDIESPEPDLTDNLTKKLDRIDKKSRNRKLFIGLSIFILLCIFVGIVLSIVLPLTLIQNSSTNNTSTVLNLVTNQP